MGPQGALLTASAAHLGFQAVVTVVVYPALRDLPATGWQAAHAAHSRRIAVVVAPVYLALAAACGWALLAGPVTAALLVAVGGAALAGATTAAVAAPTHDRLRRSGPDPGLLRRLLAADRVRLLGAVLGLLAAAAW